MKTLLKILILCLLLTGCTKEQNCINCYAYTIESVAEFYTYTDPYGGLNWNFRILGIDTISIEPYSSLCDLSPLDIEYNVSKYEEDNSIIKQEMLNNYSYKGKVYPEVGRTVETKIKCK